MRGKKPVAAMAFNVVDGGFGAVPDLPEPEWTLRVDAAKWGKQAAMLASEQWDVVAAHMRAAGTVGPENAATIEVYCRQYARWLLAEAHVSEHGPIVAAPRTGVPMQNPYLSVANAAAALLIKTAAELGLPPSMRARVTKANGAKKKQSAADAYLGRKGG